VCVAGEERVVVPGIGPNPSLEGMFRAAPGARRSVLLCHAHPLYAGSMHCGVIVAIVELLASEQACASLRFNYRGVGESGGEYDGGRGETLDARAALRWLREQTPGARSSVCGHSFGAFVGFRAAAAEGDVERVALIAPAGSAPPRSAFDGSTTIFVGDQDRHCSVQQAEALAEALRAGLEIVDGADHFFVDARPALAAAVLRCVAPEVHQ
jgi:hypothetical protein